MAIDVRRKSWKKICREIREQFPLQRNGCRTCGRISYGDIYRFRQVTAGNCSYVIRCANSCTVAVNVVVRRFSAHFDSMERLSHFPSPLLLRTCRSLRRSLRFFFLSTNARTHYARSLADLHLEIKTWGVHSNRVAIHSDRVWKMYRDKNELLV